MNAANIINSQLSMWDVAVKYGFEPNRSGFIRCPFHNEKTPSLKIYDEPGRGWNCFGCNKGGSATDFVARLFNITYRQALIRLNVEFDLNLLHRRENSEEAEHHVREQRMKKRKEIEYQAEINRLAAEHCRLWQIIKTGEIWSEQWCDAHHHIDYVSYCLEVMACHLK